MWACRPTDRQRSAHRLGPRGWRADVGIGPYGAQRTSSLFSIPCLSLPCRLVGQNFIVGGYCHEARFPCRQRSDHYIHCRPALSLGDAGLDRQAGNRSGPVPAPGFHRLDGGLCQNGQGRRRPLSARLPPGAGRPGGPAGGSAALSAADGPLRRGLSLPQVPDQRPGRRENPDGAVADRPGRSL